MGENALPETHWVSFTCGQILQKELDRSAVDLGDVGIDAAAAEAVAGAFRDDALARNALGFRGFAELRGVDVGKHAVVVAVRDKDRGTVGAKQLDRAQLECELVLLFEPTAEQRNQTFGSLEVASLHERPINERHERVERRHAPYTAFAGVERWIARIVAVVA